MNYKSLSDLLPSDEIHYLSDVSSDQPEYSSESHEYILFEYTIDSWTDTIQTLKSNNIPFTIKTDSFDLQYILI